MRYKLLGKSGLRVSEICLGTMNFGEEWGYGANKEECKKIFDAFTEAGGNFFDTADTYTNSTSEKFLGEFIASDRDSYVIGTKYTTSRKPGDPSFSGNCRKNMVRALDASLKRLNTDYIDIYWVHMWDYTTPIEEVMRSLDDAVKAGKILYVGFSNVPAWIISRANLLAEFMGWSPAIGLQIRYNLLDRSAGEREYFPMAEDLDIGVLCWQPLAASILSDPHEYQIRMNASERAKRAFLKPTQKQMEIATVVWDIAKEIGCSPAQVALNWVRQQKGVIIPIVGARLLEHIEDNLKCLDFKLNEAQMQRLDEVSKVPLGFPYDNMQALKDMVFGNTFDQIDSHRRTSFF